MTHANPATAGLVPIPAQRHAEADDGPRDRPFNCFHHLLIPPDVPGVIGDLLAWLNDRKRRTVLDPDSRTWLRYDPPRGIFSTVPGTAEQAARMLIAEAAESAIHAYDAGERAWHGGSKYPFLHTWKLLTENDRLPEDPSASDIARAMVDTAAGGDRADWTRRQLAAGRSPKIMFLPMSVVTYPTGDRFWETSTDGLGYLLCDLPDAEEDACEYQEIPLRAAGYSPDLTGAAACPGFDHLCSLVWPDPAVRNAALRSLSMGFTGRATKYVIYWRSETGRGKSLMAALMSDLLGGYAKSVPAKTLFGYSADPQRAAEELAGTWLAITEEGIGDRSFKADAAFKLVTTGGGDMNARQLYRESRQVQATHTVLLAVNPEADMNYRDPAIMARLCPVRFDGDPAAIAAYAETYNPASAAWKAEAPAVLAKMLGYARDFWSGAWKPYTLADVMAHGQVQAIGEELAEAVEMRTDTNVGEFIDAWRAMLAQAADGHRARKLFDQYESWARAAGREAVTETAFGRALLKCDGVAKVRTSAGAVYRVAPASR